MSEDEFLYVVNVSDEALDAMLLAATEAYCFGVGRRTKGEPRVEVDGYLWGFHRDDPDANYTWIQVERFAPSMSSRRSPDWVEPNEESAKLMHAIMTRRTPQLAFVGEVHTHPYDSLSQVLEINGWEFSKMDREATSETVWQLCGEHSPLWIVIAIAPLQRVQGSEGPRNLDEQMNVWQFDVGEMRFWLHAEVAERDDEGTVHFPEHTVLYLLPRFLNAPGDRIL